MPELPQAQTMVAQLPVQGGAAHTRQLHEAPPVASCLDAQFAETVPLTSFVALGVIRQRQPRLHRSCDFHPPDASLGRMRNGPLNDRLEFSHITGPVIVEQR